MPRVMFHIDLDRVSFINDGYMAVLLPRAIVDIVQARFTRIEPGQRGRWKFVFDVWKKERPRTTGWKSQQAHLHGHLSTIADALGYYMSEIKEAMKEDLPDWPRKTVMGKIVYMSEADADTVLESKGIEWCHVKAAEFGIKLVEDGDE